MDKPFSIYYYDEFRGEAVSIMAVKETAHYFTIQYCRAFDGKLITQREGKKTDIRSYFKTPAEAIGDWIEKEKIKIEKIEKGLAYHRAKLSLAKEAYKKIQPDVSNE